MSPHPVVAPNSVVTLGNVEIGNAKKLTIIAGPCQLESRAHAFDMAGALKEACGKLGVGLIYKTSFDKANRTSASTARGIGLENALPIFADIRKNFGLPVLTDVHERDQCAAVAAGVACVFMEVHQDPDHAPSDGPNMVHLKDFPALLEQLVEIDAVVKRA